MTQFDNSSRTTHQYDPAIGIARIVAYLWLPIAVSYLLNVATAAQHNIISKTICYHYVILISIGNLKLKPIHLVLSQNTVSIYVSLLLDVNILINNRLLRILIACMVRDSHTLK